jgi:hypothetical protein
MDPDEQSKSLFESLHSLRNVLADKNVIQIIHPGAVWNASFTWHPPASQETVSNIEAALGKKLPKDFALFLVNVSDGVVLYYDIKYGQWGYRIFGSSEIIEKQAEWEKFLGDLWVESFTAIGEIIDENHPIIFNSKVISPDKLSQQLIEGNPLDPDHLITAQGAKFWDWK